MFYVPRKSKMSSKQRIALLKKALEEEKKRSASFSMRLKKPRNKSQTHNTAASVNRPFKQRNSAVLDKPQWDVSENSPEEMILTNSPETDDSEQRRLTESSFRMSMNNLSFASLNIPECKPVEGDDDIDRRSFEQWREMLETSMQLVGVTDEYTKVRLFKIKAGSKLLSILENTSSPAEAPSPESYPYSNAVTRLQNFFGSRDYRLMQRQKLRSMTQNVGESDVKYVKRVVAVAKLCDFNDEQLMENVAYVIQSHAPNPKIREISRKILRKGGSIATLLEKIQAYELERVHEDIYQKNHSKQPRSTVAAVTTSEQPSRQPEENGDQQGSICRIMRSGNYGQRNEALGRQIFGRSQANRGRGAFNRCGPARSNTST